MIRLDTVNRTLKLFLGTAHTTAPLQIVVSYSDQTASTYLGGTQLSNSNGTTAVTICSAPAASTIRDIDMVSVLNTDTASKVVTVEMVDTATPYLIATVTLLVGEKLTYTHGSAWQVVSNSGNIKYVVQSTGGVDSFSGGSTGLTPATATTGAITLGGTLAVANGGTGTASPSLVAGTNISITGTWPNQTVNSTGGTGTVTSVAATVPAFLSVSGSPITTSGTLALTYSGTALPVANGGTGVTTSTGSGNVVLSTSPSLTTPTQVTYEDWTSISGPSYSEGRLWYDSTQKSLAYFNDVSNNTLHIGQETQLKVYNNTGSTIARGAPVYITSTASGFVYPLVALAKADTQITGNAIGLTNQAIPNATAGYVTISGLVNGLSLGSMTVGDTVYISPYSAGQLMNTYPPTGYPIKIGVVAYANTPNGSIYVSQSNAYVAAGGIIGTVAIANGGTNGSAVPTNYGVAYGTGTAYAFTAAGTTGQVLTATTGGAPTWASPATNGTVTSVSFTGGIVSVATSTTTPSLTVTGTSGGIPYFSSGTTWASSAALDANALVVGGGAGVAPSTVTTGTGVVTALGVNTGTAGAFVVNGGALGTPSSGTVTNLTGTASININGTVGATTPDSGAFTSLSSTGNTILGDASTDTVTVNGYMGVGGAATADRSINILGTSTATNVAQEGIRSAFTANSTATTAIRSFISVPATQAAAFTVTDVAGFWAANATLGAGSTITNAHGLYIANQTRGTNNYGITSLIASGTNKWNIYASGTADNYFAGNMGIGTATPVGKIDVFGASGGGAGTVVPISITVGDTSTGNAWPGDGTLSTVFNYYSGDGTNTGVRWRHGVGETTASGQYSAWKLQYRLAGGAINSYTGFSDAIVVDPNGNVLIGTASNASTQGATLQAITAMAARRNIASASGPAFRMEKSRATTDGTYTIVSNGDTLGEYQFYGADGVQYIIGASVKAVVDAAPGVNDMPTALTFNTTADGAAAVTERLRITSAGGVSFGSTGTGYGSSGQVLTSNGNASPTWGTLGIGAGGTGQTTASAAFNALSPVTTTGDLIVGNGTNSATRLAIGTNNYVLTSNGTTAVWAANTGGTGISTGKSIAMAMIFGF